MPQARLESCVSSAQTEYTGEVTLCRNGLHELDPDDPWRGPRRERCRPCYRANRARYNKTTGGKASRERRSRTPRAKAAAQRRSKYRTLIGVGALADARYRERWREKEQAA